MSGRINRLRRLSDPLVADRLQALIAQAAAGVEEGKDCSALIAEINELSGRDHTPEFFLELDGWTSTQDAAALAAKGAPPALPDLTRGELVEIVGIIEAGKEPEASFFMDVLERNFPGSWSTDLVFHPHREMTTEEIVDELLLREELHRAGGWEAVNAHLIGLARGILADPDATPWALRWAKGVPGARA